MRLRDANPGHRPALAFLKDQRWRPCVSQRLWAEPDMRIVSAGIPDYDTAVPNAHFCLHTEGNGWGARVVDYMITRVMLWFWSLWLVLAPWARKP